MTSYTDWSGPHRKDRRKSDKYMPWDAFPYAADRITAEHERRRPLREKPSDGTKAFALAFTEALKGRREAREISCLRGQLRAQIIRLADSVAAARKAKSKDFEITAWAAFAEALGRYCIVHEEDEGQMIWRARLPRHGEVTFAQVIELATDEKKG